jgi:hypothetical protein
LRRTHWTGLKMWCVIVLCDVLLPRNNFNTHISWSVGKLLWKAETRAQRFWHNDSKEGFYFFTLFSNLFLIDKIWKHYLFWTTWNIDLFAFIAKLHWTNFASCRMRNCGLMRQPCSILNIKEIRIKYTHYWSNL